jgi:hypothetical protein
MAHIRDIAVTSHTRVTRGADARAIGIPVGTIATN